MSFTLLIGGNDFEIMGEPRKTNSWLEQPPEYPILRMRLFPSILDLMIWTFSDSADKSPIEAIMLKLGKSLSVISFSFTEGVFVDDSEALFCFVLHANKTKIPIKIIRLFISIFVLYIQI